MIEIKLNKEIQDYHESVFFGLSMRQTICSAVAIGVAVGAYLLLEPYLGTELVSWVCLLVALPFALMGFVRYHGMTAERLLVVWLRCMVLSTRDLYCTPTNLYYELMKDYLKKQDKEAKKKHESYQKAAENG